MKKYIFSAALFLTVAAGAQNLDPTVEVRRAYEGRLLEANKPQIEMTVPDSLTRFDLTFDYSVFDTPYKGSYEFNPYRLVMSPVREERRDGNLYLRAGAGYSLHPTLDFVWSPVKMDRFKLDIYASERSFVGAYRNVSLDGSDAFTWDRTKYFGYSFMTTAGTSLRYDWNKGRMDFDVAYYGIANKDNIHKRAYDALDVKFGISSKSDADRYFLYDISAAYHFAEDKTNVATLAWLGEHLASLDMTLGQVFGTSGSLLFDFGTNVAIYKGVSSSVASAFRLVPHYAFGLGRWKFDLGLKVETVVPYAGSEAYLHKGQYIYPDVKISVAAIPDAMKIYLNVGGGEKMNTMYSLVRKNKYMDMTFGRRGWLPLDSSVERVNAVLGIEGRISTRFGYGLHAGYSNSKYELFSAVVHSQNGRWIPAFGYSGSNRLFAGLDWNWKAESIEFKGELCYDYTKFSKEVAGMLEPSEFEGETSFTYNWKERIYAGVSCAWATGMKGIVASGASSAGENFKEVRVPGYADLGVNFSYAFNRKFSLWVEGGNLLNMTIQKTPLYVEGGISFTAGICLAF